MVGKKSISQFLAIVFLYFSLLSFSSCSTPMLSSDGTPMADLGNGAWALIENARLEKDNDGNNCLVVLVGLRHERIENEAYPSQIDIVVFQNGTQCQPSYSFDVFPYDSYIDGIEAGNFFLMEEAFILYDMESPAEIEVRHGLNFEEGYAPISKTFALPDTAVLGEPLETASPPSPSSPAVPKGDGISSGDIGMEVYVAIKEARLENINSENCLVVSYDFRHESLAAQPFWMCTSATALQNGIECEESSAHDQRSPNSLSEIKPGFLAELEVAYILQDKQTPVTVEVPNLTSKGKTLSKTFDLSTLQ